jgi:glycosyltransferase involved in cell wall biosynthesis
MTDDASSRLGVLMVTGAYYPELSGGGLQARAVVHALKRRVNFMVLTTSIQPALPAHQDDDGVAVYRILVRIGQRASELTAALKTVAFFARTQHRFQIVNVHGFSRKSVLLHRLSRLLGKRFVLTLQTGGHDEPAAVRALGAAAFTAYADADLVISVSPSLARAYVDGGLPETKLRRVSNAVDTERFRPATDGERRALRRELDLPEHQPIVLFVGYFSSDKRPDVLYDAWARINTPSSTLVFVGATESKYKEVDPALADRIRAKAEASGRLVSVRFVPPTPAIEKYFRSADVYVLPSCREGLPIALLEAMSCGLPCVATRLEGSTDSIIQNGTNGWLVDADHLAGYTAAMQRLLSDVELAHRIGTAARARVVAQYSIKQTAEQWLAAYREVLSGVAH